jgi:glucose dehydrogenase
MVERRVTATCRFDRPRARRSFVKRAQVLACAIGFAALPIVGAIAQKDGANRAAGARVGDPGSTKYSPLDQITAGNVKNLKIAWRHAAVDAKILHAFPTLHPLNNLRSTPLFVDDLLYASNALGFVEAMDPASGATVWAQQPLTTDIEAVQGASGRGVAYWTDGHDPRIFSVRGKYLFAFEPKTGKPIATFGQAGKVDLVDGLGTTRFGWTAPAPVVVRDVVVVGGQGRNETPGEEGIPPGDVRAYDVRSGTLRWTFHVIPREGEYGLDTWKDDSWKRTGSAKVWSMVSADEELGYVYVPLSSAANDWYGGHRPGDNLFSDTLVCLDARNGHRLWHRQLVHHDLWDYDLAAAPILADITVNGKKIRAVVQLTKTAQAFVFDRATGEPVWPIEERAVAPSSVPGEQAAPTQPFPTKPAPFDRQGLTIDDLIDFTPELRAEAIEIAKDYVLGPMYTPPTLKAKAAGAKKGTLYLPGWVGGANWTGAAFDPETAILYVPSVTAPFVGALIEGTSKETFLYKRATEATLYLSGPRGLPLTKPPYGRLTAIDLNRGEHVWMVPNGDGPRNHPALKGLNLPPLGQPGRAAPLLTRTLLFLGEGDPVGLSVPPGGGGNAFRAYDKATGRVLWQTELPAGTTGAPMTYLYGGKQYIVVPIGGQAHSPEFVALSLP